MTKTKPVHKCPVVADKESYLARRRENPQLNTVTIELVCEVIHGDYNNPRLIYRRQFTKTQLINLLTTYPQVHLSFEHYGGLELRVVKVSDFVEIVTQLNKVKTKCP